MVIAWGSQFRVYVNGALYIYREDSGWKSGSLLLGSYNGHHHFENVRFGAIAYSLASPQQWSDYTYQVRARADATTGQSPIVVFRWQDDDNHYFFYPTGSTIRPYHMVAGTVSLVQEASASGLLDGNWPT